MMSDAHQLPPAGAFRNRAMHPCELLARTGAVALHPKAAHLFPTMAFDPDPARHSMRLSRSVAEQVVESSDMMYSDVAAGAPRGVGVRPDAGHSRAAAGVSGYLQTARTRGEFKHHAVVGQYSNEVVSAIPGSKKSLAFLRNEGTVFQPHQKATSTYRRELERHGRLDHI
mmetsp:Transcript_24650/g.73315  ORF Transcript_24650/g.73315 Transcript_24650/m.73315 type:complete len:170 (-) Transcript_24650:189-698(-)